MTDPQQQSRELTLTNRSWVEVLGLNWAQSWRGASLTIGGRILLTDGEARSTGSGPSDVAGSWQHAYVDVRVVGYTAGQPATVMRTAIGRDGSPVALALEPWRHFQRLAVLARLVIDGIDYGQYGNTVLPADPPKGTVFAVLRVNEQGGK